MGAARDARASWVSTVELMDPVPGLPDLVFTANAGLVYRDLFISSRFRFGVRQGETPHFERWARSTGSRSSTLPGGLALRGGRRRPLLRRDALRRLPLPERRAEPPVGRRAARRRGPAAGAGRPPVLPPRHLLLPAGAGRGAIYYPGAFDDYGRSVLRDRIPNLIEVSAEEAVSFSCNAVVVGRTVVLNDGAPEAGRAPARTPGYAVRPLGLSEFIKSGGSAKCLTLRLDGEEAASLETGLG